MFQTKEHSHQDHCHLLNQIKEFAHLTTKPCLYPHPTPESDQYYKVAEFIQVINKKEKKSTERGKLVAAILKKKYVPISKAALYRLLSEINDGLPAPSEWRVNGQPPIADKMAIDAIAQKLKDASGLTFGKKEVSNLLVQHQKQKIEEAGHVPLNVPDVINRQTLNNYVARCALHPELSVLT